MHWVTAQLQPSSAEDNTVGHVTHALHANVAGQHVQLLADAAQAAYWLGAKLRC